MTKRKKIIIAVVVAAGLGVGIWLRLKNGRPVELEVGRVERQTIEETLTTTGYLKADQYAELTFPSSEVVQTVNVRVGDQIFAGQTLAVQDQLVLGEKLAKANSVLEDARYDLAIAPTEDYRIYKEVVNQAWHDLEVARKNLTDSVLYAPFYGTVIQVNHREGELSSVATPTITIANFDTLYFETEVPEDELSQVAPDQEVLITFDTYPDSQLSGLVSRIHPQVTTNSNQERVIKVEVVFVISPKIPLTIDLAGDADFIIEKRESVLVIPQSALDFANGEAFVYKIGPENRVEKVVVEIGLETDDWAEVITGLEEGEEVATDPELAEKQDGSSRVPGLRRMLRN